MNLMFQASTFLPIALGFFGLGTGYLIYGPQELFGWPKRDERVDRSTGVWGIWMPGFCQLLTGVYLFVGLTWFQVFKDHAALHGSAGVLRLRYPLVCHRLQPLPAQRPAAQCRE